MISYSIDNGETWTEGTTLTVSEAVTVLVKAVKAGAESEVATFAYTIKEQGEEPAEEGLITDLSTLKDGDTIVIYNPANKKAMSETDVGTYYRAGVDATVADGKIAGYDASCVWTVGVKTEGGKTTYTFTSATGRVLTAGTRSSLPMDDENPDWTLEPAATEGCVYIRNAGRDTQYVEWYADKNEFSAYKYVAESEAVYAMQLYLVTTETPDDPTPTGDTYGLASKLATGDKVIIYNAASGTVFR